MKIALRIIVMLLCLIFVFCMTGCEEKSKQEIHSLIYDKISIPSTYEPNDTGIVCENSRWILKWDDSSKQVAFLDKQSQKVWTPATADTNKDVTDDENLLLATAPITNSAVVVSYYDSENLGIKDIFSRTDAIEDGDVYIQEIENGLRVCYDFMAFNVMIPVEYKIEEDCFTISVNPKHIADDGENYVVSVALAPFLCGTENNTEESWLFIPDGSGSLISTDGIDKMGRTGELSVYGNDLSDQVFNKQEFTAQVHMPVFGAKVGDNALFAIIESGEESSKIAYNVGSNISRTSGVYAKFDIHGYSTIKTPRGFSAAVNEVPLYSENVISTPIKVSYHSLSGEQASVYGMAKTYQDYLVENKNLTVSKSQEKLFSLKYIGATMQPDFFLGIPTEKVYPLTTISDVQKITEEFIGEFDDDFVIDMVGFGESGVDIRKIAGGFKIAKELGNKKQLKSLTSLFDKNKLEWYMDFDILTFSKSGAGFKVSDAAVFPNMQSAFFTDYNTVTRDQNGDRYYIVSRKNLTKALDKLMNMTEKYDFNGLSLDSLSHIKYSDFSNINSEASVGISDDVEKVFNKISKSGYNVLSDYANDYAAIASDRVIDAPTYSSNLGVSIMDVPFYQLVLKGYIPMSSTSINLSSEPTDAILRCIESGISPSYTITNNYDTELITSQKSFISTSNYEGNKKSIKENISSIKECLNKVKGAKILNYSIISKDVRKTVFDNGVYVIVNYGDIDIVTDYGKVSANSFIIGSVNK